MGAIGMDISAHTSVAILAALLHATPFRASASPSPAELATPCPPATDATTLREIERRVVEFRHQADLAHAARDWTRTVDLLLRAEHNLPVDELRARASILRQTFAVLREATQAGAPIVAPLERTRAAADGFLEDVHMIHGPAAATRAEVVDVQADLERTQTLVTPAPTATPPIPVEGPIALPKMKVGPSPAEFAAQHRRERALAASLGVAAGITTTAFAAAIGTTVAIRPNGSLYQSVSNAVKGNQEYPEGESACDVVDSQLAMSQTPDPAVAGLCNQLNAVSRAGVAMWVTTGVFAVVAGVLGGVLARERHARRRQPHTSSVSIIRPGTTSPAMLRITF